MAFCAMAVVSGHTGMDEAEHLLLSAQDNCEWFCPLCIRTIPSLSISGINSSLMSLQPKIVEVNTIVNAVSGSGVVDCNSLTSKKYKNKT